MSEEKTKMCPKCGTENKSTDSFCAECGEKLNNNEVYIKSEKAYRRPFTCHVIIDFILFCIFTFGISFWLMMVIPSFIGELSSKVYSSSEIDNAQNIMHQIYYLASNANTRIIDVSVSLYLILGAIIGLLLVFSIWSVIRYNRIEKRIIDTQELVAELKDKIKE